MHYRKEIDGLRAFAIIPVILFHAGFEAFSSGFVGVDVFFVISGYLITSILIMDLEKDDFTFMRFYERRARRILPALLFVIIVCLPFALLWMLPVQLKNFSQSIVAVVFFASNILFWLEEGYFVSAAELKPLLHTWSLAVEEQYYLLFPVLLVALWRFGRSRAFWILLALAAMSLLLAEWGWRNKPSANFYLAPTRAWELLVGSLCAFLTVGQAQRTSNAGSMAGILLIVLALIFFDANTPFPSAYTLAPVVGTALIILYAGPRTWVTQLLSLSPMVAIGLISYSAYLWHQPLFAFAKLRSPAQPTSLVMLTLVFLSLLLAWGTWFWVEQPFRKRENALFSRQHFLTLSACVTCVLVGLGMAGHFGYLAVRELTAGELEMIATATRSPMRERCHFERDDSFPAVSSCVYFGENPTVAVYGNSHGVELAYALAKALEPLGRSLIHFTVSNCKPSFGLDTGDYCSIFYTDRLQFLLNDATIDVVVLAFRTDNGDAIVAKSLVDLANYLNSAGRTVLIALQAPTLPRDLSAYISFGDRNGLQDVKAQMRRDWTDSTKHIYEALQGLHPDVVIYDLADTFCDKSQCYAIRDGGSMYVDDNHMSVFAANRVAQQILAVLP